jgi:hypothetical protein
MFSGHWPPHPPGSDTPESKLRLSMMLAEIWHEWFETLSQVAYKTHRACEFLAENGAAAAGPFGPFDPRSAQGPSEWPDSSIDMDKLKQCLQSMEPTQAAQVMHAVQTMQAMEAILKGRRARANDADGTAW